ncbi:phiSA1p31-related protein [Streptomyces sp. NPDC001356]
MSDIFDRHRIVDFTEHPLVVLIDTEGGAEIVGDDQVCKLKAAAVLRVVADVLASEHEQGQCRPPTRTPQWRRPAEPLIPHVSTLDRGRSLWTDGTGHVWDLSVPWGDAYGRSWRWTGDMDRTSGAPLMATEYRAEQQPLDVLRATFGPIAPLPGGAA